ncbi:MAG: isochorismatase family protein [Proteobacteria bacterium]|nr:isochorismatase family protein [Pseudomonadota bacterium]
MTKKWGVIVIDIQGDFTKFRQGSLAVPGSDEDYVKNVETANLQFKELGVPILGTQDWHPPDHISFVTSHPGKRPFETIMIDGGTQVLWPPHCIQGTENARVLIDNSLFLAIVKNGQDPDVESYSFFQDGKGTKTEMDTMLRVNGIEEVILYGIATEYCVRATSLDLLAASYKTTVIEGLCRGVSLEAAATALDEMRRKGARVITAFDEIIEEIRREISDK